MTLNGAIAELTILHEHSMMPDIFKSSIQKIIETVSECEEPSAQSEKTQIIRCGECKFYTAMNREAKTGICSLLLHQNFGDDWYCAGAERRTDE